ncbi:LamG domain-containing protein [Candidatus Poribacteria bacterium]|nr:LamG domain-containing protein [Candidatus Poribacteria bacterium]MBT5533268.1 LamG domain-containing protein [Candidatus Poribacteria bacterium]MBT5715096.1 LamG domain-containing protein [Candidatus Poribacteria bacterium]MBT7096442.1 LamG domain-containing protein [Candidatus Poribacteria bacterium]MBT7807594.1 LamG domain-containing protein [Candidatus Poribacteria bacterium]
MLAAALSTSATAGDLLVYLDFEQTPPQHPHFLSSEPGSGFSFDPLELDALERSLARDPEDSRGFTFEPLDLNALTRSLTPDPFIDSLNPPTVSFTGRALDRSGGGRDALALGNVILLEDGRSTAARFDGNGRLQFAPTTWAPDVASKRAVSVLGWVNVHQPRVGRALTVAGIDSGGEPLFLLDPVPADVPFKTPVGLFPYITGDVLHWSLHSADEIAIFILEGSIAIGEWFHVAGTYDAAEGVARLYLNGEEVVADTGDAELMAYSGPTGIVTINPSPYESAWSLDDLNIWGRALSGDEVRSVMQVGPVLDNATAVDDGDTVTTWGTLKAR